MKILAIESSAVAASVCVCADGKLIAQSFQNNGLTHSRTLMPMLEHMLSSCGMTLHEINVIAVAAGPGSFTGLRIGVSAAKGLAWPEEKPCCAVSTLEAMAWNLGLQNGRICCAMDARRKQVYHASFEAVDGQLRRLTPDRAIALSELFQEPGNLETPQIVVGDGARLCWEYGTQLGAPLTLAPGNLIYPSAWGVARAAMEQIQRGELLAADQLKPVYLRLSQAERERMERLSREQELKS